MCNEGERLSPYPSCQLLRPFIGDSTNRCCQMQRRDFQLSSQNHCNCLLVWYSCLPLLNTPIFKAWGGASRAQHPLTASMATGIAKRRPAVKGHHVTYQLEEHTKLAPPRASYSPFNWRIVAFTGCNKKACYNRDEDRSIGFCCQNALGLMRSVRPIPRPNGLFRTRPRALSQAPSEPALIYPYQFSTVLIHLYNIENLH